MTYNIFRRILPLFIMLSFCGSLAHAEVDVDRGLKNYEMLLKDPKKVSLLSQEELTEVMAIHHYVTGTPVSSNGHTQYEIEVAHNDEFFIINGEKYEAKTYCLGWDIGEYVIFLEGSEYGACASAKLYNTYRDETCEVWCE